MSDERHRGLRAIAVRTWDGLEAARVGQQIDAAARMIAAGPCREVLA